MISIGIIKKVFWFKVNRLYSNCLVFSLVLAVMIAIPQIALAAKTITSVNVQPSQVTINQDTSISVQGTGKCNFSLDFGDGSTVTVNNNFKKGNYQTSHSWNSTGTKTVKAVGQGPCTGTAQDTVVVSDATTPTPGKKPTMKPQYKLKQVPGQKIETLPTYELKKVVTLPKIEGVFDVPLGPLRPGTKLLLKGKAFGTQPGKILMYGNFPGGPIELVDIKWESDSKVNGVVPLSVQGQANQSVEIKILAAPPPQNNFSNGWKMSFIGRPYCGEEYGEHHLIYNIDGTIGRDCSPYACIGDQVGVDCIETCTSTAVCAKGYTCSADDRCVVREK